MGLKASINLDRWNFPKTTPLLNLPINYAGVGELFVDITTQLAQSVCPVDTGFLKSSIGGRGEDRTGTVQATAEYAQYVEYGTWKMEAQPYFTSAVEQGAEIAFMVAMEIYINALQREQEIITGQMMGSFSLASLASSMTGINFGMKNDNSFYGGYTQTVHGISFRPDGSVSAGVHGYYLINPSMWRKGTLMYEKAVENRANLGKYRAQAMSQFKHDAQVRSAMLNTNSYRNMRSGATNFGYGVAMYSIASIISSGGSFLGGVLIGALLGIFATLIGLVLGDIFGGDEPEFSTPKIEIT